MFALLTLLHTSDWHLGASLSGTPTHQAHSHFLDWLVDHLTTHPHDLLLVTGNIFHTSHPTPQDVRLLHNALARIAALQHAPQTILLAGSHDSAALLDASADLLSALGIHTVADPKRASGALIPVRGPHGEPIAVVAALPFVRALQLGVQSVGAPPDILRQSLEAALSSRFARMADEASTRWPTLPLIAAAHLSLTQVPASERFHPLHSRRFRSFNDGRVAYSGAPIPLSVEDVRWTPHVLQITFGDDKTSTVEPVEVPTARDILILEGTPDALVSQLVSLSSPRPLAPLLVLRVRGDGLTRGVEAAFRGALARFPLRRRPRILRIEHPDEPSEVVPSAADLLDPEQVFRRLVTAREGEPPDEGLLEAFRIAALLTEQPS
jgi:exonuclease SbcD